MKKFSLGKLAAALAASAMILTAAFTGCSSSSSGGGDEEEGKIESVSITSSAADEAVDSGTEVTLTAAVAGDISTDNVTYTWEVTQNSDCATLSATSGNPVTLTVANSDESAHEIIVKVTASNKNDSENSVTNEVSVTVKGKDGSTDVPEEESKTAVLSSVSISGTQKIASDGEGTLTAAVSGENLSGSTITYSWEITSGADYAEISENGASAAITGKDANDADQTVKVKVTATLGETSVSSDEYSVTVVAKGVEVKNEITGLSASASADSVDSGKTVTLTAEPTADGNPTITYTWKISEGEDYADLSATDTATVTLTAKNEDSESHAVKVTVTATDGENEKTAEVSITVNADTTPVLSSVAISGETSISAAGSTTLTATPTGKNLENASVSYTWSIASGSSYASISGSGASAALTGKNTTTSEQTVKVKVTAKAGTSSATSEEYSVTVAGQKTGGVSVNVTLNDETKYFTVKFVDSAENGNGTKTYKVKSGESVADKVPDWTKEGSLIVWKSSIDGVTVDSEITQNVTFTASWSSAHTVTFKDADGGTNETVTVEVADGEAIDASKIPAWTKEHYTLSWTSSVENVTTESEISQDVTFTAVWTEDTKYTVTFKDSDSSNGNADVTQTIYSGEKASVPEWTKENYTLSWSSSVDEISTDSEITADVTFTAVWTENTKYTVTFKDSAVDGFDTQTDDVQTVYEGKTATVPTWTKTGLNLTWTSSVTGLEPTSAITANVTFTASWSKDATSWTAGDTTTPSWISGLGTAEKNTREAFKTTNGSAFANAVSLSANGTFTITPSIAGTYVIYVCGNNNSANKGTASAKCGDTTIGSSYSLPARGDTSATSWNLVVGSDYIGKEITISVSYASLLFKVDIQ